MQKSSDQFHVPSACESASRLTGSDVIPDRTAAGKGSIVGRRIPVPCAASVVRYPEKVVSSEAAKMKGAAETASA